MTSAAGLSGVLTTYTGVLIGATAVPARDGHRSLRSRFGWAQAGKPSARDPEAAFASQERVCEGRA